MSNPKYMPVSESCALQMLNSATVFEEYLRAERVAAKVRGGMYWKRQGKYEYLVRTTPQNQQTRVGARSPETEQIYTDFFGRKAAAEQRLRTLGEALLEAQRLNRAVRAGRVPNLVVALLRRFREAGVDKYFAVVGTYALYAYEAAAGVRIATSAMTTQGVDVLWDAKKRVSFVTDLTKTDDKEILQMLRRVDASFQLKELHNTTAINSRGFEVEFLPREHQYDDPHPRHVLDDKNDLRSAQTRNRSILPEDARFEMPVIALNGSMALMNTIPPSAFVRFKEWHSTEESDSSSLKRACDKLQVELVQQLLEESLLFEPVTPCVIEPNAGA